MASKVFLGHGGFSRRNSPYPLEVLVPPDTTLRFFSDAGQPLYLPINQDGDTDYTRIVKVWDHFHEDEQPLPARWVTYNYALSPEDTEEERQLALSLDWGADVVTLPAGSDDLFLCQGTAETCPTPALNVQQRQADRGEGDAVPADRWNHDCDGILGQHAGNDLIWVACTSFNFYTPELPPLMTADYTGPGFADNSGWMPDDDDWAAINELNARNIKDTDDGGSVAIVAGGYLVLIGEGHGNRAADYVARQGDVEEGMLTVEKGGTFSRGEIEVSGISGKQAEVEATIAQFSKKTVTFV